MIASSAFKKSFKIGIVDFDEVSAVEHIDSDVDVRAAPQFQYLLAATTGAHKARHRFF